MITFTEVLHKIATDILSDTSGVKYDFNMCITDDLKHSEEDFTKKYGTGKSYHFPIANYEHGRQLALAIYQNLSGRPADVPAVGTDPGETQNPLYLYIYLSPVK